jgi:hypothetical protein
VYSSTVQNPTIDINDEIKVVQGSGTGPISANLTGLAAGNTYYIRAYATNLRGTAYGDAVSVDFNAVMPEVITREVTNPNIGAGTATFNGTIQSVGDPPYTERGFVYAATHNPTINDTKKEALGSGTGDFSVNVANIAEGTVYYVRAYATNANGTVYGEEMSVNFHAVMPTLSTGAATNKSISNGSVTINGTILTVGDPAYTERGFVYGTVRNPTVDDNEKKTVSGTGTGDFSANFTELEEGNIYYVKAYASNSKGTVYGEEVSVDFNAVRPTLNIHIATNKSISNGSVTIAGSILTVGDPAYTERGFVYGTIANPTIENNTKIMVSGTGSGDYNTNISGLTQGTVYYMRGYAISKTGTTYSSNSTIVDFSPVMPTVATRSTTNQGSTTATFNGNITDTGDPVYVEKGFVYSTSQNPEVTNSTKVIVSGSGTGSFSADITGLSFDVSIYVRAYVVAPNGTVRYGGQDNFTLSHPEIVRLGDIMVTKSDIGGMINWTNANTQCNNLTLGGYSDWRLPTITELTAMYGIANNNWPQFLSQTNVQRFHYVEYPVGVTIWEVWDFYWSSTASGSHKTLMTFVNGTQLTEAPSATRQYDSGSHDYSNFYCRCVRTLP